VFVRAPEGNGCAERFIRTLKKNLLWVRCFETIEEMRQALLAFRESYNSTWLMARHGFQTPAAMRHKQLPIAALAAEAPTRCLKNRGQYTPWALLPGWRHSPCPRHHTVSRALPLPMYANSGACRR
jgi:hypothetical protein